MVKGCFDIKKNYLGRNQRFSAAVLSQIINSDVDAKRVSPHREICYKIYRWSQNVTKLAINHQEVIHVCLFGCIYVCTACFYTC